MGKDGPVILAVDIGTSSARALLFDQQATLVAEMRRSYPMAFPQPGWSEQDPDQVLDAVIGVMGDLVRRIPAGNRLDGVVFSSQMYSVLAVDSGGKPMTKSLLWSDIRARGNARLLRQQGESKNLHRITGCPVQAIYPLSKILWLRETLELPASTLFISIKDYVLLALTDALITDWSTASASGLMDISEYQWSPEALDLAGLSISQLPELAPPREVLHRWRPEAAREIGIQPGLPLILGGGDAPLANIGVGATEEDSVAVNIGTSAAARITLSEPLVDSSGRLWTYVADEGQWVMGGIIGGGGAVYDWLLRMLLKEDRGSGDRDPFAIADQLAEEAGIGADGLLFLPYLSGEFSPGWNIHSTGTLHGLTFRHETKHVIRATLEGIAFALLRIVQVIEETRGPTVQRAYLTGRLTASAVWQRMITDVLGRPVTIPSSHEASARGAAILGWITLGNKEDPSEFTHRSSAGELRPHEPTVQAYRRQYRAFCRLFDQVKTETIIQEDLS